MIHFTCRHCDRDVQCPPEQAGSSIDCPLCGRPVVVPLRNEVSFNTVPPRADAVVSSLTIPPPPAKALIPQTIWQRLGKFLFSLLIVIGATALTVPAVKEINEYFASEAWPTAPGLVQKSGVEKTVRQAKGIPITSYKPAVAYVFLVNKRAYPNNRIRFGEKFILGDGTSEATAQGEVKNYPIGGMVQVIYDPSNPSSAVLERRLDSAALLTLVAVIPAGLLGLRLFLVSLTPFAFERTARWGIFTRRWHWYDILLFVMFAACGFWQVALRPLLV